MKYTLALLMAAGVLGSPAFAQVGPRAVENPKAVLPTNRRAESLKSARDLLSVREPTWRQTNPKTADPFYRTEEDPTPVKTDVEEVKTSRTDADLLKVLASQITPTGSMIIGDEPFILVNGRRVKVGDLITIPFEGAVHQVRVTSIQRNSYTLRLNNAELQREFK